MMMMTATATGAVAGDGSSPSSSSSSSVVAAANNNLTRSPLFESHSTEEPSILAVSFAGHDPSALSLGAQLCSHDNGLTNEMFLPGYASVGGIAPPDDDDGCDDDDDGCGCVSTTTTTTTLARRCGVRVGDYLVAVNGEGYRRFPPDFREEELRDVTTLVGGVVVDLLSDENFEEEDVEEDGNKSPSDDEERRKLKGRVMTGKKPGDVYGKLLARIREAKSAQIRGTTTVTVGTTPGGGGGGNNVNVNVNVVVPMTISFERYSWDSRVHSWSRFLSARGGNVPAAMTMMQAHERWRNEFFPIDLTEPSLQRLLKAHAVSEIDVVASEEENERDGRNSPPPVVYIDFARLQAMGAAESETMTTPTLSADVARAFVGYTETLLSRSPDPRSPKTSQFVDLTGVSFKQGLRPEVLRGLYGTFEPNYPETLEKMVLYPVPRMMVRAVNAMLGFVNEHTRKKFIITDDLVLVCKELGWNLKEIETCGSVNGYMKKHLKHGCSFVFD